MLKEVRETILEKLLAVDSRTLDNYNRALRVQTQDEARSFDERMINPKHPWLK
jgi:hypothetical protein